MVGRIVLFALQFVAGWIGTPAAQKVVLVGGQAQPFVNGVAAAAIVWITGLVGAQFLKDVSAPTPTRLVWALAGGLIGGAVVAFRLLQGSGLALPPLAVILLPAILAYHLAR